MTAPHHSTDDLKPARRLLGRAPRTRSVIAATGLLVICIAPFAAAKTGSNLREGCATARRRRRRRSSREIASTTSATGGYSTRQSNLSSDGGGAIYGCRSKAGGSAATPKPQNPCIRANNLSTGLAFEFNAAGGDIAGLISVGAGGDTKKPFTTNATGVATGLNADRLDSLDAAAIIAAARAKTGLDADTVDGATASDLQVRFALVDESGDRRSGARAGLASQGSTVEHATDPNIGIYAARLRRRSHRNSAISGRRPTGDAVADPASTPDRRGAATRRSLRADGARSTTPASRGRPRASTVGDAPICVESRTARAASPHLEGRLRAPPRPTAATVRRARAPCAGRARGA